MNATMAYHWARLIELLYSAEKIQELLNDKDLQGTELVREGKHRGEGIGIVEAPRGTLFHHYQVNEQDQVTMANLIVSTTSNNEPMNRAVQKVAKDYLEGQEITEGLLNHVEVAIRAYDPCLSCATHAVGRMPLEVRLERADGGLIQESCEASREWVPSRPAAASWCWAGETPGAGTTGWVRQSSRSWPGWKFRG